MAINYLEDSADMRVRQENADEIADLEHLANRLVQSPWFREFIEKCEALANVDVGGMSLMDTDEAQAAVAIAYLPIEEWRTQ